VAGEVSINRTLFGIHLYDINLGSDGIVGVDSSEGYLESGPHGKRAPMGSVVVQRTEPCSIGLDQIQAIAFAQGLVDSGGWAALANLVATTGTNVFTDSAAMDQLLTGQQGTQLLQLLIAANVGARCSHINVVDNKDALDDTVAALKLYIKRLQIPTTEELLAPFVGEWIRHTEQLTIRKDGTGEVTWAVGACNPDAPSGETSSDIMCNGHATLKVEPHPDYAILTYQKVWYETRSGQPVDFVFPAPQPGDAFRLTPKGTDFFRDTVERSSAEENAYEELFWCGPNTNPDITYKCGA
jgi:hypothetical protein